MEGTEFLLKWNNYHSNLSSIFTRWWKDEVFVDCTLVIERKEIRCHRFVLSACSPFFESLLTSHSAHPHPLILLHEVSYDAVFALIEFMYHGEVNVSRDLLPAVVKAAGSLKIKGISDSPDIAEFTKQISVPTESTSFPAPLPENNGPALSLHNGLNPYSTALVVARNYGILHAAAAHTNNNINKYHFQKVSSQPLKKRRLEEPLPLSPPISVGESLNSDPNRISPESNNNSQAIKEEHDDESSDIELQIDESASASHSSSSPRSTCTPGMEIDNQDLVERLESAKSLASLATHGVPFGIPTISQPSTPNPTTVNNNAATKKQKAETKNNQRRYTNEQLHQAVESVLANKMQPAKAIAFYNIPRRTFFRKLSNERKARGISSSRDNGSDSYLASPKCLSPTLETNIPLMVSTGMALKNWHANAANALNGINANAMNGINAGLLGIKDPSFHLAQQYILKTFTEQNQKENECVKVEAHQGSDAVSSTNSSEKPLGEKNGFDN